MTVYEVKRLTAEKAPCFFTRGALQFFGQTMKSFRVVQSGERKIWRVSAPMYMAGCSRPVGETLRFFYRDDLYWNLHEAISARWNDEELEHAGE